MGGRRFLFLVRGLSEPRPRRLFLPLRVLATNFTIYLISGLFHTHPS